jgi:hypothetical protein
VKLTLKLQLEPAGSVVVQEEFAMVKSLELPPAVVAATLVSAAEVLLESWKDWSAVASVEPPTGTSPKSVLAPAPPGGVRATPEAGTPRAANFRIWREA